METLDFHHEIRGYLCGPLWCGAQGWIPAHIDLAHEDARTVGAPLTLRDHCLAYIGEHGGDFVSTSFGDADLVSVVRVRRGERVYDRTRVTRLADCGSIADLVDAEFLPEWEDSE